MKNVLGIIKSRKFKMIMLTVAVFCLTAIPAAATTTPTVAEQVQEGVQTTISTLTSTVAVIAPASIAVVGLTMAWKYGINFMKSLVKK